MLSRGKMKAITDQMRKNFEESGQGDRRIEEAINHDQAMFTAVSYGGTETSMIPPAAKPIAFRMIERLKSKYQHSFHVNGKTKGVLRNLEKSLRSRLQIAEGFMDVEKTCQYQAALRLLTAPDSHFHSNCDAMFDEQYSLREVLAHMWIATNDIANGAILRPQHERELNLIIDGTAKANKRKEIQEQAIIDFIFNLVEIRRAHNTTPLNAKLLERDRQSCVNGAFGRLVFNGAHYNAITTLTNKNLSYSEIEMAAKLCGRKEDPLFDTIPKEIENFILRQLKHQDDATKKSIFLCYTDFTQGELEPLEQDASAEEFLAFAKIMDRFVEHTKLFNDFLAKLNQTNFEKAFIRYLRKEIKFNAENSANIQLAIQLYRSVIADMQPNKLLTTSYIDVYQNQEDRNFIYNLRRVSVPELQKEKLEDWSRNEKVLALRVKIRELSYQIELLNNLIVNEVRRGLLLRYSEQLQTHSEKSDKSNELLSKIIANVNYYFDFLQRNLKKEFNTYQAQLVELLQHGKQKIEEYVCFSIVLSALELQRIQNKALRATKKSNDLFNSSKDIATQFLALQASANSQMIIADQVQSLNQTLGMEVNTQWNTSEAWATEIVRIAQSTMHDKQLEIDRIKAQMESVCNLEIQLEIKKNIGAAFTKAMRDPKNSKLTWQERRQIVQALIAIFPNDDLGLKYQTLKGFKEVLDENDALFIDQQLAHEVFDAAGQPLLLATLETEAYPLEKAVDSNAFNEAYNRWYSKAASLLELDIENPTMEAFCSQLNQEDKNREIKFKKLEQLIILTVYRNLQLTDMRMEDIQIIRWLCNLYLRNPEQKSLGNGPMFNLEKEDNLSVRLHYFAVHLCCMLTTLKPVATLYNTGHIRIMNGQTAREIWDAAESKKNGRTIFIRTSIKQPHTLSITVIDFDASKKTDKDVRLPIPTHLGVCPDLINRSIEIAIVNAQLPKQIQEKKYRCQLFVEETFKQTCYYSLPELTLASSDQIFAKPEKRPVAAKPSVAAQIQRENQKVSGEYMNHSPKAKDEVTVELAQLLQQAQAKSELERTKARAEAEAKARAEKERLEQQAQVQSAPAEIKSSGIDISPAPNPSPFPTVLQPSALALPIHGVFAPPRNPSPPPVVEPVLSIDCRVEISSTKEEKIEQRKVVIKFNDPTLMLRIRNFLSESEHPIPTSIENGDLTIGLSVGIGTYGSYPANKGKFNLRPVHPAIAFPDIASAQSFMQIFSLEESPDHKTGAWNKVDNKATNVAYFSADLYNKPIEAKIDISQVPTTPTVYPGRTLGLNGK